MDFRLSSEAEALRQEAREFARREWDPQGYDFDSMVVTSYDFDSPEARALVTKFEKKLIARGWYTMHWPEEHGGKAISIEMQMAYREGMAYEKAPASLGGGLVAPVLMIHGSDWQKREFLPRIANADIEFGQGFSEPNAGSDLANLQTRAVVDGDDLVITGQKIWSSGAHFADWYHALVRTDPDAPKHRGITYVLVPLRDEKGRQAPGVVMRPLFDMMGRHRWNEVFLDGVRVPRRNVIGEMNRGWYVAMTTLSFERSNVGGPARMTRHLEDFISHCRQTRVNGAPLIHDPLLRHILADLRVNLEANRMLAYRVAWMQSKGEVPVKEASMVKMRGDVMFHYVFWPTLGRLLRDYGLLNRGDPRAPHLGIYGANAVLAYGTGIGGGATEIQRNIIAQRGLGLPR